MTHKLIAFVCLASLIGVSDLRAQCRWHIVHPDRIDTFYYGVTSISCREENCSATMEVYGPKMTDSNIFLHSTDGGLTWTQVDSVPQWISYSTGNESGRHHLYFDGVQQIDSLDAIAVDLNMGAIVRTFDGWKTLRLDTSIHTALYGLHFANLAEGMVDEAFGLYLSTIDSGKHWTKVIFHGASSYHSYGGGMFRVFQAPNSIYTTHDNWKTIDRTIFSLNGPFADTSLHPAGLIFTTGDTLAIVCSRWDKTDRHSSVAMTLSADLGANWSELPVPRNNGIFLSNRPAIDWDHIVLGGVDSLGRILSSTDRGASWRCDTVPLSDGAPYYNILNIAVTGSSRVIASVISDSNYLNSSSLVYLERTLAGVTMIDNRKNLAVYPNPASSYLRSDYFDGSVRVSDPLGRSFDCPWNGHTLDISRLPPGVYYVSDGTHRARFVKE